MLTLRHIKFFSNLLLETKAQLSLNVWACIFKIVLNL